MFHVRIVIMPVTEHRTRVSNSTSLWHRMAWILTNSSSFGQEIPCAGYQAACANHTMLSHAQKQWFCGALPRTDFSSHPQVTQILEIFTLAVESFGASKWTVRSLRKVLLWLSQQWLKSNASSPEWMLGLIFFSLIIAHISPTHCTYFLAERALQRITDKSKSLDSMGLHVPTDIKN